MHPGIFTTGQIAQLCGVSHSTVIRWIDTGILAAYKIPPNNKHRRVRELDLQRFAKKYGLPLDFTEGPKLKVFAGE